MTNMTWNDAILTVLKESDRELTVQEIVDEIGNRRLRGRFGRRPTQTARNHLTGLVRERRVIRIGRGLYYIRKDEEEASEQGENIRIPIPRYGLFWKAENVKWGSRDGGVQRIYGKETAAAEKINIGVFSGVYILFDRSEPMYVGRAERLGQRLFDHTRDRLSGRWDRFSWFEIDEKAVHEKGSYEFVLIEIMEPRLNRRSGDYSDKSVEFQQVRDPDLEKLQLERILKEHLRI